MKNMYRPGIRIRIAPKFFEPFNIEIKDKMLSENYDRSFGEALDEKCKPYSHYVALLQNPETGNYDKEIKIPRQWVETQKRGEMIFVYGDDGFLEYYFVCPECGTIAIEDHREDLGNVSDYGCPECNNIPREKYPFSYLNQKEIDKTARKIPESCLIEEMKGLVFSYRSILQGAFIRELEEA